MNLNMSQLILFPSYLLHNMFVRDGIEEKQTKDVSPLVREYSLSLNYPLFADEIRQKSLYI